MHTVHCSQKKKSNIFTPKKKNKTKQTQNVCLGSANALPKCTLSPYHYPYRSHFSQTAVCTKEAC